MPMSGFCIFFESDKRQPLLNEKTRGLRSFGLLSMAKDDVFTHCAYLHLGERD